RSTLKQFVRYWSENVRDLCYEPVRGGPEEFFEGRGRLHQNFWRTIRVLVPGAGPGRLAYEEANLGMILSFACQGNGFPHHMLLSSRRSLIGEHTIYPYIHSLSNIPCKDALLRPVKILDVLPSDLPPGSNLFLGGWCALALLSLPPFLAAAPC
ncbi:N2227-like protein, partial [Boletus coccyginus]